MREKSGFSSVTNVEIDRLIGQTEMNWYTTLPLELLRIAPGE